MGLSHAVNILMLVNISVAGKVLLSQQNFQNPDEEIAAALALAFYLKQLFLFPT